MANTYTLLPGGATNKGTFDFVNIVRLPEKITTKDQFIVPPEYNGFLVWKTVDMKDFAICGQVVGAFHFDEKTFSRLKFKKSLFKSEVIFPEGTTSHMMFFLAKPIKLPGEQKKFVDITIRRKGNEHPAYVQLGVKFIQEGENLIDWKQLLFKAGGKANSKKIDNGAVFDASFLLDDLAVYVEELLQSEDCKKAFVPDDMYQPVRYFSTINFPEEVTEKINKYVAKYMEDYGIKARVELIDPRDL